jgi:hypothetical protein
MTHATLCGSVPWKTAYEVLGVTALALAFAFAPQPALAQHGGGGGHFGGGGHLGGGGHAAPAPMSGPARAPMSGSARPAGAGTPYVSSVRAFSGASRPSSAAIRFGANAPSEDHFLPPELLGQAPRPTHTTIGFPPVTEQGGHWQPIAVRPGAPMSFSGQGHDIWQDSARPSRGSAGASPSSSARFTSPQRTLRFAKTPLVGPNVSLNSPFLGNRRIRRPFPPFFPIFPGFWGGSFFGFGFGFGPTWGLGWDQCDPGWGWGYSSFCGPNNYTYGYYGPDAYLPPPPPPDEYEAEYPQPQTEGGNYLYEAPSGAEENSNAAGDNHYAVVIYLKDGTVYVVDNYWLSGGELHYKLGDGSEYGIDVNQIDLQKTVDVNAKRGVDFTLRNSPDQDQAPPPAQETAPAPAGPPSPTTDQHSPAAPNRLPPTN